MQNCQSNDYKYAIYRAAISLRFNYTRLSLKGRHYIDLPSEIAKLRSVHTLDISNCSFGADAWRKLSKIKNLRTVNLNYSAVGAAEAVYISNWKSLRELRLNGNNIGVEGAKHIGRMRNLKLLDLDGNDIKNDGAHQISKLPKLERLSLRQNNIDDFSFVQNFNKLRKLDLSENHSKYRHSNLWVKSKLKYLCLYSAQLGDVPNELLSKSFGDNCLSRLRPYFSELKTKTSEPDVQLFDVKVMILGNGRVGKTQLRRRLMDLPYDDTIPSTHGVEILETNWPKHDERGATPLKIWDFGGQEIYLGTHALFLKTRAVFPILWIPEMEHNETEEIDGQRYRNYPLDEWVRYVQALAGKNSPVLIIQAQCEDKIDAIAPTVTQALFDEFSITPVDMHYSARTDEGKSNLYREISSAVAAVSEARGPVRIPATWNRIKIAIENGASQRCITKEEYFDICKEEGPELNKERAEALLGLLHEFGTLFYDISVLENTIILDQNWALDAIYSVFDRSPGGAYDTLRNRMYGRFIGSDLERLVWGSKYTLSEQNAFISMMQACSIVFPLRVSESGEETLFIAPELLPPRERVEQELSACWDERAETLTGEFRFSFLVPSFLREVMRTWGAVAGQSGLYWKNGLSFYDSTTGARTIIEVQRPGAASWSATVFIATQGKEPKLLLRRIALRALEIAERFGAQPESGATVDVDVFSPDGIQQKARWVRAAQDTEDAEVKPAPQPVGRDRCFISYAHGDDDGDTGRLRKAAFKAVRTRIEELGLYPFFDEEQLIHGESVSGFIKTGSKSPKFVVIMSSKYLKSPFCMDELRRIWRICGQDRTNFQSRVKAVCLPGTSIDELMEREVVRQYWVNRRTEWREVKSRREMAGDRLSLEEYHEYDAAESLAETVAAILLDISDALHIRSLEDIPKLQF